MSNQRKNQKKQSVSVRKPQELSFVLSQLDSFATIVGYGYSENNWILAGQIYKSLEGHLHQSEREILSLLLRDTYVSRDEQKVASAISLLKQNLTVGAQ